MAKRIKMVTGVWYTSCDGCNTFKRYKTKKGLSDFINKWVGSYERDGKDGEHLPPHGSRVSPDGIGRVAWEPYN